MMKSFFQIVLSIVLGTFLGQGLYNKLMHKRGATAAQTLEVNPPLLSQSVEFEEQAVLSEKPVKVEDSLEPIIASTKAASTVIGKAPAVQTVVISKKPAAEQTQKIVVNKIEPVQTVKLQAQKLMVEPVAQNTAIETTIKQVSVPVTIEGGSTGTHISQISEKHMPEEVTTASAESKPEKKRFLFFQKKNK